MLSLKTQFSRVIFFLILLSLLTSVLTCTAETDYLNESQEELEARLEWWTDARFGMFIHWGLYAIPAGTWNGEQIPGIGEWIMASANIPVEEYEKLAAQFNPTQFDAEEWVQIARDAGQKYMVITSKHHDGFCLWDSDATEYDVVDATPYGMDILEQLANACEQNDVTFGVYYSIIDWHHPSQYVDPEADNPRSGHARNKIYDDQKDDYINYMKTQIKELVNNYDPNILWFDGDWAPWWTEEDGRDMYAYVRSLKEDIIINNRVGTGRTGMSGMNADSNYVGDFGTPEKQIPDTGIVNMHWETCMTMNETWGFKTSDDNWKSTETLIHQLIDAVSKGGNYLLNVGPKANGVIPEPSVVRLQEIGRWMDVHGDAIYGAEASPYQRPEWGRFTSGNEMLFAHVFDWPADQTLQVQQISRRVSTAAVWTEKGPLVLDKEQGERGLTLIVPEIAPDPISSVIAIEYRD